MSKKRAKSPVARIERPVPLVTQVEQALRRAIAEGAFSDGRLPTEVDLAERFGVSRETVRRSTQVLQEEGLLRKYRRRGTILSGDSAVVDWGSAPATAQRILVYLQAEYRLPGATVEGVTTGVAGLLVHGASQAAAEAEWDLLVRVVAPNELRKTLEQLLRRYRVGGVIAASFAEDKALKRLVGRPLPVLLVDHDSHMPRISSLRDDSAASGRMAVEHLVALGHRRIAYAHWHQADLNPWRGRGYREGLRTAGIRVRSAYEMLAEITPAGAAELVEQLLALDPMPTALVCFNNTLARLVIEACRIVGRRVADDLSVVGCGGEEVIGLSTCQNDWHAMGRRAVELLLKQLQSQAGSGTIEHVQLTPTLRPGDTTAAPRRTSSCPDPRSVPSSAVE